MGALEITLLVLLCASLTLSVIAVILVFAWRKTTPEISGLRSDVTALALDQATIVDKFRAYMAREDARAARAAKKNRRREVEMDEDDYEALVQGGTPGSGPHSTTAEQKNALRRRVFGNRRTTSVAMDQNS